MFGFCKKIPEYTIVAMHNGKWCLRYNHTNIPYICKYNGSVVEYDDIDSAKFGIENLKRADVDVW